ncbi:hypothetical protein D3C80_1704780 [compost metagenome]
MNVQRLGEFVRRHGIDLGVAWCPLTRGVADRRVDQAGSFHAGAHRPFRRHIIVGPERQIVFGYHDHWQARCRFVSIAGIGGNGIEVRVAAEHTPLRGQLAGHTQFHAAYALGTGVLDTA